MLYKLGENLVVEQLGDEFLVCDPSRSVVHRLSSSEAPWFQAVIAGRSIDVDNDSTLELERVGVIQRVATGSEHNRRAALKIAAASVAAVGLSTLALPSAAAAASIGRGQIPAPVSVPGDYIVASQQFTGGSYQPVISAQWRSGTLTSFSRNTITWIITGPITATVYGGPADRIDEVTIPGWVEFETINVRMLKVGSVDEASFNLTWGSPTIG